MKFTQLDISNFLTLGTCAPIFLDNRGLNVIQGQNDDDSSANSNGAGKSSIVDGLCWCLYGVTARGAKGDGVVNRTAKKNAQVAVTMTNGETAYRITRYRKHATHKNQAHIEAFNPASSLVVGATGVRLDKGTEAETQKEIEKILGCSYEVFVAAVYAGQEMMPDLPRMGDRDLKRLIEEGAGMQRIERAYQVARDRMNAAKLVLTDANTKLGTFKAQEVSVSNALKGHIEKFIAWRDGRTEALAALADHALGLRALYGTALAKYEEELPAASAAKTVMAALQMELSQHAELKAKADVELAQVNRLDKAIERTAATVVANAVAAIKTKIENAAEHMKQPCIECGKPHTEAELADYLAIQNAALVTAQESARAVVVRVREQMATLEAQKVKHAAAVALIPDVTAVSARMNELREQENRFVAQMRALDAAKATHEAAKIKHEVATSEANPHALVVEEAKRQLAEVQEKIVEVVLSVAEADKVLDVASEVVKLFGPAGVRAQILDTVTPYLNARTADYLSVLSDGNLTAVWSTLTKSATGELKEKFAIEVTNATGGDSFTSISGGEKRKVRLATSLALQDLVASRAVQPIELWLGDEIDDALDTSGLERLMTILERKARERGTVLVISHNDLSDWADQITTVRKKDGTSTVEGALVK